MKRSKFIILICGILTAQAGFTQSFHFPAKGTTIYLVRHAEKDSGANPALSKQGYERAGDLNKTLKDARIDQVYFTQYRRSRLTADSVRIYQRADTISYKADNDGEDLFRKINEQQGKKKNILVIGHSNTIPAILQKLGVTDFGPEEIPDNEYDNLYVVVFKKNEAQLKRLKYGKVSPPAPGSSKMKPLQ